MSAIHHPEAHAGDNIDGRIINAWPVPLALQLFDAHVGAALRCGPSKEKAKSVCC